MRQPPLKICASLVCADLLHLGRDLEALAAAGVDYLHVDVMDGQFVPNFCLSPDIMRAVRRAGTLPLDVHLMVERPERYLETFVEAGAAVVTVHQEATVHLQRVLSRIRALGARAGVALNPATSLHTLDYVLEDMDLLLLMTVNPGFTGQKMVPSALAKIADARRLLAGHGLATDIQVDGNVSFELGPRMARAGANWLVGGTSSVFQKGLSIEEGARRLRALAEEACADVA
ncbi:MAG: ribulose-phosphate 3-epimerase [Anaerolineae bacterium]